MFSINFEEILFLDIETAPLHSSYAKLDDEAKVFWERKNKNLALEPSAQDHNYQRAGIYAEFGRIVCICVGKIARDEQGNNYLKLRSFFNDSENMLLIEFAEFLKRMGPNTILCAHNGKEFDFPFICRRMLIQQVALPHVLQIAGKKPWEIKHLDTLELWKFGDYKHYTSLDLLAYVFGIESPKTEMNGSQVAEMYHSYNNPDAIIEYCFNDVITIAQLLLRFNRESLIESENIYYV